MEGNELSRLTAKPVEAEQYEEGQVRLSIPPALGRGDGHFKIFDFILQNLLSTINIKYENSKIFITRIELASRNSIYSSFKVVIS